LKKRIVVPVFGMIIAAGCGSALRKDTDTLSESIRVYNEGVRWQRYAVAATAIPPAQRATFVDEMDERANELKISDYEIVKVDPAGAKAAKVQVKVSWYTDREGTLHETHALQSWEQHGKEWWMVDAVRVRGHEMPGLTERAETEVADTDDVSVPAGPEKTDEKTAVP
jgi:hypothetical protein